MLNTKPKIDYTARLVSIFDPDKSAQALAFADGLDVHWVGSENALYDLIDEIDSVEMVALDTEFIRRTTYLPILALVQVNTGKGIYLIDAPRLDLSDFWQAIYELPATLWYAMGEDLAIFYELSGLGALDNAIDAQILVKYLCGAPSLSYRAAVGGLGMDLDKGATQSDWLKRPLTAEQERYAADDVRYLWALYEVAKDAVAPNLLAHATQDAQEYAHHLFEQWHMSDDLRYLDYVSASYTPQELAILQALCAWREQMARDLNEPRGRYINNAALRLLVEQKPSYIGALPLAKLNPQTIRVHGKTIIALIKDAQNTPISALLPLSDDLVQQVDTAISDYAACHGIDGENITNKKVITLFCQRYLADSNTPLPRHLTGVRHDLGAKVLDILHSSK